MAESQKLYPVFEIPAMQASDDTEEQVFLPAPLFDFDTEILSETVRTASSW